MKKLPSYGKGNKYSEKWWKEFIQILENHEYVKKIYKSYLKKKFVVLCGPGNNGGDGLVISQALKKLNQNVTLYCLDSNSYKGDAKKAYKKNNLIKNNYKNLSIIKKCIIIDCLFGIGLNRKIKGIYILKHGNL